jgi:hypothetical protein
MGRRRMRTVFVIEKPEAMTPLRIHVLRLEDIIKMDFKETELEGVDWINLAQDSDN